jgi:hypothetical protein
VVIVAGLEEAEVAPVLAAVEEYVAGGGRAIVELAVRPSDHVLAAYRPTFYSGLNIRIVTADHPLTKEYRVGQVLSYGALGGTLIPTHPAEAVVLARYTAEGTAPEYQSSDASQGDGAPALLLIPHGAGYFLYSGPTLGIAMGFQPTGLRSYAPLVLAALRTLTDGALVPQLEVDEEGEKGEEATRLAAGSLDRDTWAHPANAWLPGPDEPGLFWHEGEFFGDVRLEMTFRRSTEPAASATLLFDGDEPGPASRYALVAERVWDTSQVTVRLLRDTTVLEQTVLTVEPTTAQHRLYLARTGSLLCGGLVPERNEGLEDRPLLSCHLLPEGLRPVRVGFRLTGTRARIRDACVRASHIYRYHFNRAPTDWWVGSGTWEITERWSCNPAWAWFGGWNERGIAEVWHKRRFRGDVVLDFFIAPRAMRAGGDEVESWANLGATLCGDGRDVTSGYSVLCGVSGSPRTELRRAGRVVAERSERWLPTSFQGHLQWWHLRFTRRGNHVALWHDRQVILDYRDPNPLPGGQLALWTRDNGLLLPQVTIYFESADGLAPAP